MTEGQIITVPPSGPDSCTEAWAELSRAECNYAHGLLREEESRGHTDLFVSSGCWVWYDECLLNSQWDLRLASEINR